MPFDDHETTDDLATVLIVDDDTDALEEIEEILELEDVRAVTAPTIRIALEHLQADPSIHVVVTDMHLLSTDGLPTTGIEFIDRARKRFPARPFSFIMLSGDAGAITSSMELGAVDFLTKPLMPDALLAAVRWASIPGEDEEQDFSSILMRKVEQTTKSLQKVSADLAARERELSASQETYERHRIQGARLRRAMNDGHIVPWFQPQVCVETGRLLGFEALARWEDPVNGLQSPAAFLPLAQEIGALADLDAILQRKALDALFEFHREGIPVCDVGLNLSATQLADPAFVDNLCLDIDRAGLDPAHVSVEVLESVMLDEVSADPVKHNITRLAERGLGIELDDFGTGHAGLSSLRDLTVSRIKIDRSFVTNIHQDAKLQKFTRALIGLAKTLGVGVLAEGVETADELNWLANEGCDAVQGFFIAKPMRPEEAFAWAQKHQMPLNTLSA